jgi:hypothetical protein
MTLGNTKRAAFMLSLGDGVAKNWQPSPVTESCESTPFACPPNGV